MKSVLSVKTWIKRLGLLYVSLSNKREYASQRFTGINERPVELQFVFRNLTAICPTTVLDVGTGTTALPHLMRNCGFLVTATDNIHDYWQAGMVNQHYHVINDDITRTRLTQSFDFITCISVLEHIQEHRAAMRSMFSLLKPGGHLIATFPYHESRYAPNVYELPESGVRECLPFSTQAFSRTEVDEWLDGGMGELLEQEFWQFFTGDYWTCGDRICPPKKVSRMDRHQISCCHFRKTG